MNHPHKSVGTKTLIIGEIGVNHNRDLSTALKLCDVAKERGASVVKTQLQENDPYTLAAAEVKRVYEHCESIGIPFACTAFDENSLRFLLDNTKLEFIKIASGQPVETLGKHLRVIMSTGGMTIDEIRDKAPPFAALLHCVSEYPTPIERANLRHITMLRECFPNHEIGLSDHSGNPLIPALAVALGASVIECHLTLDRDQEGPDHRASLDPEGFGRMVENVRQAELACHVVV